MSARLLSLNLQEQVEIGESEDPTEMESYVHQIQEWLQKQPHLTVVTGKYQPWRIRHNFKAPTIKKQLTCR